MTLEALLLEIDSSLEDIQYELIDKKGGDPGHEILFAGDALELIGNQLLPLDEKGDSEYDLETFISDLSSTTAIDSHEIRPLVHQLRDMTSEQFNEYRKNYYDENTL